MSSGTTTIRVSALSEGDVLDGDIVGPDAVLLLARGSRVRESFLEKLRARGIEELSLEGEGQAGAPEDSAAEATPADDPTPRVPPQQALPPDAYDRQEDVEPLPRLGEEAFGAASTAACEAMRDSLRSYGTLAQAFRSGRLADGNAAVELLLGLRRIGDRDIDLMSLMASVQRAQTEPLLRHAVRHAVVAMRLGRRFGFGPDATLDAGLVALFSDIGMTSAAEKLVDRPGRLSPTDWERVHRHCGASADLVQKIRGVRAIISHAVYQHHERPDGSGYPRGRSGSFLHPLARVAAVADVFTAVTEDRPHRPARTGHHAVRATLEGVRAGRLDGEVVRALLLEASLFPVGTPLVLSNGRTGRVHRTGSGTGDRPIVAFDDGQKPGKADLSLTPDVTITGVSDGPKTSERAAA